MNISPTTKSQRYRIRNVINACLLLPKVSDELLDSCYLPINGEVIVDGHMVELLGDMVEVIQTPDSDSQLPVPLAPMDNTFETNLSTEFRDQPHNHFLIEFFQAWHTNFREKFITASALLPFGGAILDGMGISTADASHTVAIRFAKILRDLAALPPHGVEIQLRKRSNRTEYRLVLTSAQ